MKWDLAVRDKLFELGNDCDDDGRIARMQDALSSEQAQFHEFVDASDIACSWADYIRTAIVGEDPDCVLNASKTKVTPLKPMSILRYELQICVLRVC